MLIVDSKVFIIGGGPSLKEFNFSSIFRKDIIAVNQAIFDVPWAKHFITMDYTFLRKSRINSKIKSVNYIQFMQSPAEKIFVVGSENDIFTKVNTKTIIDNRTNTTYDLYLFNKIIWAKSYGGIGLSFDDFRNSSDSGYSALQLAVILGYKTIFLLGFDFTVEGQRTHYHDVYGAPSKRCSAASYDSKLKGYAESYPGAFKEIKEKTDINVFSCSRISILNNYIPFTDVRKIL
jgi:hypothetical protein